MKSTKKNNLEDLFYEESLSGISIHQSEKENLDRVFDILYSLENELSSDEDQVSKKYLKEINEKADKKRQIFFSPKKVSQQSKLTKKTNHHNVNSSEISNKNYEEDNKINNEGEILSRRIGAKALRKIIRKYLPKNSDIPNEEIRLMIWENDENLDGFLNKIEFEKMYKKCITDVKEKEPKRLFYLILFLMFDRARKGYIIEEDTLEILYIRHKQKFEEVLFDIFG